MNAQTRILLPQQNRVSKRLNYSAVGAVNTLLRDSGLGNVFWAGALLHYAYTRNRVCQKGPPKTPFELYAG